VLAGDGQVDVLNCGEGNDIAFENANEHDVFVNCEKIVRPSTTGRAPDRVRPRVRPPGLNLLRGRRT